MLKFYREIRDRNVIKVGIAYLVAAWLVLQLADVVVPALGLPETAVSWVLAALAVGFAIALVLAWLFDHAALVGIVRQRTHGCFRYSGRYLGERPRGAQAQIGHRAER